MLERFGKISNPLTVIAIFCGITEVIALGVLPFVKNQEPLLWFLILFPVLLVILFFLTLNFNHKVLYAPSDYRADSSFLAASKIKDSTIETQEDTGIAIGSVEPQEPQPDDQEH